MKCPFEHNPPLPGVKTKGQRVFKLPSGKHVCTDCGRIW